MICVLWCAAFTFPYLVIIKRCLLRVNKVAEIMGLDATQRLLGKKDLRSFVQFVITEYYPENAGEYLLKKKRLLEQARKGNKKARALMTKEELTKIKEVLDNELREAFGAEAGDAKAGLTFQEKLKAPLEPGPFQRRNPNLETEELDALVSHNQAETSRAGKRVFDNDEDDEVNFSFDKRDESLGGGTRTRSKFDRPPQRSTLSRKDQFKKHKGADSSREEDSQTHEGEVSNESSQADIEAVSQSVLKQNVVESAANVKSTAHMMRSGNSSRIGFINNLAFNSGLGGGEAPLSEISALQDVSSSIQSRQDNTRVLQSKRPTEEMKKFFSDQPGRR